MMRLSFRYIFLSLVLLWGSVALAQTTKWRDIYKVKKKDTLFGIARQYGLSLPELMDANPEMKQEGYALKKGALLFIPYAKPEVQKAVKEKTTQPTDVDVRKRAIRVGVMLPLHQQDGDGKRMVEYYRGILMACDSLKHAGISTDVHAWNVPLDADIRQTLLEKGAKDCDIIFGPLYTRQVKPLGEFCKTYHIKMVIPFSITGGDVNDNAQIFQVYQSADRLNNKAIEAFLERFGHHHPVFIDCNDTTSKKGIFTFGLRNRLDQKGIKYSITNLKSSEENFAKAFSRTQPNVVILNTGRSPELNVAFAKLSGLTVNYPGIVVSMFGYTEWLMYTKYNLDDFYKYDTYIPTTFYYNPLSQTTQRLERAYHKWFGAEMQYALPRFAITGYDHAQFFLRGLHRYGKSFLGTKGENAYTPLQTPLHFNRIENGGMLNANFMLIHYTYDHQIQSINY